MFWLLASDNYEMWIASFTNHIPKLQEHFSVGKDDLLLPSSTLVMLLKGD